MRDKEYIERGAVVAEYDRVHVGPAGGARKLMVDAPAADVVEVRHGEWEQQLRPYDDEIMCSVCGANFNIIDNCTEKFDYCPNCGAKMDGERKEQT